MISGIYEIVNLANGKKYIGQTVNLKRRLKEHKRRLMRGAHENDHLQKSWNKYGCENFAFNILEYCSLEELDEREKYYISVNDTMNSIHGYNQETGGSLHKTMSAESRMKMSIAKQGMYDGDKNPMYGVHIPCPEEKKKKFSQMFSGEGNPMYGVHLTQTEEQRRLASIRNSGTGNPFYGCKHSEETKIKMRQANKKKKPVRCVETGIEYESACEIERQFGYDSSHVNACCNGKAHTAYGFHWEFVT